MIYMNSLNIQIQYINEFIYIQIHYIYEFMQYIQLTFHTSKNHTVRIEFPGKFLQQHDEHCH
jgi:hypothetical protein